MPPPVFDSPAGVVEPALPADVAAMIHLMAASPLLRRYEVTTTSAEQTLAAARAAGDTFLAHRPAPGQPLDGFAWLIVTRILNGGAYLRLLLVDEARQSAGIGHALLAEAERVARQRANHLYLLATADNLGARRFYERHGYRHVGDLPDLVAPGLDEALYYRALRPFGERVPT